MYIYTQILISSCIHKGYIHNHHLFLRFMEFWPHKTMGPTPYLRLTEVVSVGVGKTSVQLSGGRMVVPETVWGLVALNDSWGLYISYIYPLYIYRDFPYRGGTLKKRGTSNYWSYGIVSVDISIPPRNWFNKNKSVGWFCSQKWTEHLGAVNVVFRHRWTSSNCRAMPQTKPKLFVFVICTFTMNYEG